MATRKKTIKTEEVEIEKAKGIDEPERTWCVYVHKDCDGRSRYVGKGSLTRANKTAAYSGKGVKYSEYVLENGRMSVHILADGLDEESAFDLELKTYNELVDTGLLLNVKKPCRPLELPSKEYLQSLLYYDETSPSCLRWKVAQNSRAPKDAKAGSIINRHGYYRVGIDGVEYRVHRLICVMHGISLSIDQVVDHIDGDRANNKISNLRVCDQSTNTLNRNLDKQSQYGVGVKLTANGLFFTAYWQNPNKKTPDGRPRTEYKSFSIKRLGFDVALASARECRIANMKKFNPIYANSSSFKG